MRSFARIALSVVMLVFPAYPAAANEYVACWVETIVIPGVGAEKTVTRCRLAGGAIVDYASDTSVPATLYPAAGTDLLGECWYLTSATTNWVYLSLFVDGDAILGWDPDLSGPGPVAYATGRIPRCTSEPIPAVDPVAEVWEYVTAYIHPPPEPDLSPNVGDGVTGLDTFVGVPVPPFHEATLAAGGVVLDVEIEVDGVVIAWGDGESDNYPADETALAGYPTGIAYHVYETKSEAGYDISVSYDWTARWRVSGGSWIVLAVPDTTTSVTYPVAEIVSVITD